MIRSSQKLPKNHFFTKLLRNSSFFFSLLFYIFTTLQSLLSLIAQKIYFDGKPNSTFLKTHFSKLIYKIISKVKSAFGKQFKNKSYQSLFTIGLLNGFLTCGMVYVTLFGAIAKRYLQRFLYAPVRTWHNAFDECRYLHQPVCYDFAQKQNPTRYSLCSRLYWLPFYSSRFRFGNSLRFALYDEFVCYGEYGLFLVVFLGFRQKWLENFHVQ